MVAVAPAGREEQYGSYVGVDEGYHRRETIAAVAAVDAACHRLEASVVAAVVAAVCLRPGTSVVAAPAAAACHRREKLYHVHLMTSVSPGPPVPITTADDKSMRIWGSRRRTRRRPSFRNYMSLALRIGGTDGVL